MCQVQPTAGRSFSYERRVPTVSPRRLSYAPPGATYVDGFDVSVTPIARNAYRRGGRSIKKWLRRADTDADPCVRRQRDRRHHGRCRRRRAHVRAAQDPALAPDRQARGPRRSGLGSGTRQREDRPPRLAGTWTPTPGQAFYFSSAAPSSISRTQFVGNRTVNSSEAGAVSLFDTQLRISRSTFAGNSAQREGGAIVDQASELRIEDSTISGNRALAGGGGIYLFDGQTTVVNTTITRNRSTEDGGGIVVHGVGELALNAVTIARNLANSDDNPLSEGGGGSRTTAPDRSRSRIRSWP